MMKLLILTEGGVTNGFGHISRCIGLAQAFQEKISDINIRFIVDADKRASKFLRTAINCDMLFAQWSRKYKALPDNIQWADEVIIDSYLAQPAIYNKVSDMTNGRLLMLDDYGRIKYPRGIVINASMFADKIAYPLTKGTEYLLGKDYIVLRKEFWNVPDKPIRGNIRKALIAFGGVNNSSLVKTIAHLIRSNFHFDIVETEKRVLNAEGMLNKMMEADLCISGGGQTLHELARVGVPTIAICLADNQRLSLEAFKDNGFIEYAGKKDDAALLDKISAAIETLSPRKERLKRRKIGNSLVNGKRKDVVGRIITEHLHEKRN